MSDPHAGQPSRASATPAPKSGTRQPSADDPHAASLSTTPTQSQLQNLGLNPMSDFRSNTGTVKATAGGRPHSSLDTAVQPQSHWQQSSSAAMSQSSASRYQQPSSSSYSSSVDRDSSSHGIATIGRGQPNAALLSTPQNRSGTVREPSQSQRSVSYAPSDIDTISGMSASEYSSGGEDDGDQWGHSSAQQGRGRVRDNAIRQGTSIGRPNLLVDSTASARSASGLTATSAQRNRRSSATGRDGSKARRQSQAYRDKDYLDGAEGDRYGPLDEEDDEVEPHDRGEELVRRRMKARQREKALRKKAEKERSRQSVAYSQTGNAGLLSPTLKPSSTFLGQRPTSPSPQQPDRSGRPTTIVLPPPAFAGYQGAALSPGAQPAFPSPGAVGRGAPYPSPHGHIRRPSASQQGSQNRFSIMSHGQQSTVGPRSSYNAPPAASDIGFGASSVAGRSATEASSSAAGSVRADESDMDHDEERDTIASLADRRRRDTLDGDQTNDADLTEDQTSRDHGRSGEADNADGDNDDDDVGDDEVEDDEDLDDQDVEYTLKDRQDAINIEHPFGLPIWKPALYKKSRSVTRNAEIALHSIPSAAAERHLLPGNILWTILFGSWLALTCYIVSIVLNFVPLGGSRYARVIWELAGYLFWPFGKYVEAEVGPDSGDRSAVQAKLPSAEAESEYVENAFTPVAARFPHDHSHVVPFNSRPASMMRTSPSAAQGDQYSTLRPSEAQTAAVDAGESSGSEARRSTPRQSEAGGGSSRTSQQDEMSSLKAKGKDTDYGTMGDGSDIRALSDLERIEAEQQVYGYVQDEDGNDVAVIDRSGGRTAFALLFGVVLFPLMGLVCLACWGMVFTIPMAKLNWVLIKNLATRPLALHFRSAPGIEKTHDEDGNELAGAARKFFLPLKPGEPGPRPKTVDAGRVTLQRRSTILLCTYRAVGGQYYKYTVGGVNILFVNTVPLVFFTIIDFFLIEAYVEHHGIQSGFLAVISAQSVIFMLALASVIPLSYFIGMAVASISAQSSIGMGAVINATFGSIIEIILYAIALTQKKARLVEGSLIGSILAGVLLMPGLSMCSGATRRKEQRFNARSAGVTSTMLIMAIIGILTPTLFYQIYGTFQLTCEGCPSDARAGDTWTCKRCFYEHVPPATDPFFQQNVRGLMYTCTVILVLSYGVGLWFSLRTHASQIWQNPQPVQHGHAPISTQQAVTTIPSAQRASIYKRLVPAAVMQQLLPTVQGGSEQRVPVAGSTAGSNPGTVKAGGQARNGAETHAADGPSQLKLPETFSQEDYERAVALTASAFHTAFQQQQRQADAAGPNDRNIRRQSLNAASHHQKHISMHEEAEDAGGHGGHDAPSWSRATSLTVLLSCTVLYAIIAEILVDVVDVVLDGSGLDEKFLGITLFALVPNTTEFMNAMSFAINGNIALSMEIGSAYALQVCLIQIPAMVVFSAYYNAGLSDDSLIHRSFTLIFPRWDVIAIIFSVFLLTYTYIESRSNYYRGTICILSYMVLVAGFYFAPNTGDTEDPGDDNRPGLLMAGAATLLSSAGGSVAEAVKSKFTSFTVANSGAFGSLPSGLTRSSGVALAAARTHGHSLGHRFSSTIMPEPASVPILGALDWAYALWASLWAR
ncbi:hypothetical protein BCV70DRAFT_94934 [Testicularia cyperi]|uniref:Calcium permease n=1 Tax=Testicularia cyperi TaxID=1882483 RepID=A0A317XPV9_9BASI|nr:hypothetical protein BCV70DRAFT_94934 [Testicularia cyperi]